MVPELLGKVGGKNGSSPFCRCNFDRACMLPKSTMVVHTSRLTVFNSGRAPPVPRRRQGEISRNLGWICSFQVALSHVSDSLFIARSRLPVQTL